MLTGGHTLTCIALESHAEIHKDINKVQCSKAFPQVHGLTMKSPCCVGICLNILCSDFVNPPRSTQGYNDVACWVIKVSFEWSLSLVFDPQGPRAARFSQLWRAVLMICNRFSVGPKALIRISIPAAPGARAGPAYSHSQVARIRLLDLIKVSTCVWFAPATLREEFLKPTMPAPRL